MMPSYELHIEEHLDKARAEWFDEMTIIHLPDGTTRLSGVLPDQSALHGILAKIRNLNLTLINVSQVSADDD